MVAETCADRAAMHAFPTARESATIYSVFFTLTKHLTEALRRLGTGQAVGRFSDDTSPFLTWSLLRPYYEYICTDVTVRTYVHICMYCFTGAERNYEKIERFGGK